MKKNKTIIEKKYNKAKEIYIICRWIKFGILTEKYYGHLDKNNQPLIIHWNDHNGEYESYDIIPWYQATTGAVYCYTFNKKHAEAIIKFLEKEGI